MGLTFITIFKWKTLTGRYGFPVVKMVNMVANFLNTLKNLDEELVNYCWGNIFIFTSNTFALASKYFIPWAVKPLWTCAVDLNLYYLLSFFLTQPVTLYVRHFIDINNWIGIFNNDNTTFDHATSAWPADWQWNCIVLSFPFTLCLAHWWDREGSLLKNLEIFFSHNTHVHKPHVHH